MIGIDRRHSTISQTFKYSLFFMLEIVEENIRNIKDNRNHQKSECTGIVFNLWQLMDYNEKKLEEIKKKEEEIIDLKK